jgi:hypothetical protein
MEVLEPISLEFSGLYLEKHFVSLLEKEELLVDNLLQMHKAMEDLHLEVVALHKEAAVLQFNEMLEVVVIQNL